MIFKSSLLLEEEKWKRRVDALDTAIGLYIQKGYLHNDKNVFVRAGPPLCTVDYFSPAAEDSDLFSAADAQWEDDAVYPIKISFNMNKNYFNNTSEDYLTIGQNEELYLRFDGEHKTWYTMTD